VSIAAGFPIRRLEAGLGGQARGVRGMPKTPGLVGRGISGAGAGTKAPPPDPKHTPQLLQAAGETGSLTRAEPLHARSAPPLRRRVGAAVGRGPDGGGSTGWLAPDTRGPARLCHARWRGRHARREWPLDPRAA